VLFTVFQRTQKFGFRKVKEYYKFYPRDCVVLPARGQGPNIKPKYICPGCSSSFTEDALLGHNCLGGQPNYPKIKNQHRAKASTAADTSSAKSSS